MVGVNAQSMDCTREWTKQVVERVAGWPGLRVLPRESTLPLALFRKVLDASSVLEGNRLLRCVWLYCGCQWLCPLYCARCWLPDTVSARRTRQPLPWATSMPTLRNFGRGTNSRYESSLSAPSFVRAAFCCCSERWKCGMGWIPVVRSVLGLAGVLPKS